jgi:hypothetical protein
MTSLPDGPDIGASRSPLRASSMPRSADSIAMGGSPLVTTDLVAVSLRDRAYFALLDADQLERDRLRSAAEDVVRDVLGDETWPEAADTLELDPDRRVAQFVVDGLRFRVWVRVEDEIEEVNLEMDLSLQVRCGTATWERVKSLEEVGRVLRMLERARVAGGAGI